MQAVILAGGLGTRLYPVTRTIPKALVPVAGRPFLEHQLELLKRHGIDDIILLVGHLAGQIVDYFGDGSRFDLRIRYSHDIDPPLDTAGAVRNALGLLDREFFLTFGDSYLRLPYQKIWRSYHESGARALIVVYRNENQFDSSDIFVEHGRVRQYRKNPPLPGAIYINHGLMIIRRDDIATIPEGVRMPLQEFFAPLVATGNVLAWEADERFYEIGSHAGLTALEDLLNSQKAVT